MVAINKMGMLTSNKKWIQWRNGIILIASNQIRVCAAMGHTRDCNMFPVSYNVLFMRCNGEHGGNEKRTIEPTGVAT
jgi:hypothetical protein